MIKVSQIISKASKDSSFGIYNDEKDGVLLALFSDIPDYSDDKVNAIWKECFFEDEKAVVSFCKKHGIDILDDNKKILPVGYDIAVMLKSGYKPSLTHKN
jgi:hypothetical protein